MASAGDEERPEDPGPAKPEVLNKYRAAANIANAALAAVVQACVVGKNVVELCAHGDQVIKEEASKAYRGGGASALQKGIAFPTCISVNNCCGHFSPLEADTTQLGEGDVVKIDMGAHLDGYIALAAHTVHVGGKATGRQADVIAAVNTAVEVALRKLKPGCKTSEVTQLIHKTILSFGCQPVDGVMSHQMKQFEIDSPKVVFNRMPEGGRRLDDVEVELHDVFAVDIVASTGKGRARELDSRTTVYKRSVDAQYSLKLKASRYLMSEVKEKHPSMAFSIRDMEESRARMGVLECVKHDLLVGYPVLWEHAGEYVAQTKLTVVMMPSGPLRITEHVVTEVETSKAVEDEEILALLKTSVRPKKRRGKGKKEEGAAGGEAGGAAV